ISSALKLTVPSHTIHGTEGLPLHLPVDYSFNIAVSDIQIIWLFEKPPTTPKYLLGAVNETVVPDFEYKHKFMLAPPNASLLIKALHISDEGNYIVKINIHGNGTISASEKIHVTVDAGSQHEGLIGRFGLFCIAFKIDNANVLLGSEYQLARLMHAQPTANDLLCCSSRNMVVITSDNFCIAVPVTKPVIHTEPSFGVVEHMGNITLRCTVGKGTRVVYQWRKNGKPVEASTNYSSPANKNTLSIAPVVKEAIGNYSCVAANSVSAMESDVIRPTIYYGPYGLTVNSDKAQKVGKVFTVDKGEAVQLYCSADSNPPNVYSWSRTTDNSTHPIKYGRYLEVASERVTLKTEEYKCRAYNNMTGKEEEIHFFVIVMPRGKNE
ncbi:hypothetical protein lerEdw1_020492, partial [Lerista edwardsae]